MIKIYTDGSCLGNPGNGGYAAILFYKDNSKTIKGAERNTTNNRMELKAVIEGLKAIKNKKIDLEIYTDSKYVHDGVKQYLKVWKNNGWKLSNKKEVKNRDLWEELDLLIYDFKQIKFNWVKGHSDNTLNELVDKIARSEASKL
ncbi:ribonuclease HI [Candidatus Absconditicoccus praedator]|uniref:ribonuclease HI n=1 Tax=Candidatus Absconditicoccus praedator TaxID=2735562 RepID=UPI001E2A90F9|nr:ribonuclease HI [Candidatus Absconditicoccus praedator]UFX83185.1 ribonuclease HI [Candidatus Absconditicoccus praedator]